MKNPTADAEDTCAEDLMELEAQRKDGERQGEEEEPRRFTRQEAVRGFSLFEEALLIFEAQDLNVEQYRRVAPAVPNAAKCYHNIYDEKKELLPRHHWISFSRGHI